MQYITILLRQQSQISSLSAKIAVDYFVHFMISFADYILLEALDFTAENKRLTCLVILLKSLSITPEVLTVCNRFQPFRRGGFNRYLIIRSPRQNLCC